MNEEEEEEVDARAKKGFEADDDEEELTSELLTNLQKKKGGKEEQQQDHAGAGETLTKVFQGYHCKSLSHKREWVAKRHPCKVVESSSLSAVDLPEMKYPLADKLVKAGTLSDLQLEGVAFACQKFQEYLEDGERRAGFFIGDGAGIGKGRQIAGVIFDNYVRGRKRHVWVSTSIDLAQDAMRDLRDLGCFIKVIKNVQELDRNSKATGLSKDFQEGVLFTTYSTLVSMNGALNRFEQIIDWFGEGEDGTGCLVFDECHKAKNSGKTEGASKNDQGSQTAKNVREIQVRCPDARVLYCSATGISEIGNMAYLERCGFWGEKMSFKTADQFIAKLKSRGVGFLEMLAIEMKAAGKYVARSLSFEDAEFRTETVAVTDAQRKMYDTACEIWQDVRLEAAKFQKARGEKGGLFGKLYWSAHQRFFKLLCVSFKIPFVVEEVKAALRNGECALIGLQTTGEAQDTNLNFQYGQELNDHVSTTKEILRQFILVHFKTDIDGRSDGTAEEQKAVKLMPVADLPDGWKQRANGVLTGPRTHEEAYLVKEDLLKRVDELDLPANFLDDLIDKLGGVQKVCEMTGRRGRVVRDGDTLSFQPRYAAAPTERAKIIASPGAINKFAEEDVDSINIREAKHFMNGDKLIAVISDAASTGISLHASNTAPNKRRRVHLTVELPWSADKAIQQLGRSHRSNQAQGPLYVMVSTDIGGERRFVSAVARRLQSLGALTRGDRRAATGLDLSEGNVDSYLGRRSLAKMFDSLNVARAIDPVTKKTIVAPFALPTGVRVQNVWKHAGLSDAEYQRQISQERVDSGQSVREVYELLKKATIELGEKGGDQTLIDAKNTDIRRFLNRLLGIPIIRQNLLFGLFGETLAAEIRIAKATEGFTEGVNQLDGKNIAMLGVKQHVLTEPYHGGRLQKAIFISDRGLSWEDAFEIYKSNKRYNRDGFYLSKSKYYGRNQIMLVLTAPGTNEEEVEVYKPNLGKLNYNENWWKVKANNRKIKDSEAGWWISTEARATWEAIYDDTELGCIHNKKCPNYKAGITCVWGSRAMRTCLINGAVVPLWGELEKVQKKYSRNPLQVLRVETNVRKGVAADDKPTASLAMGEENDLIEMVGIRYDEHLLDEVKALADDQWRKELTDNEIKNRAAIKTDPVTPIDRNAYKKATTPENTMETFFKKTNTMANGKKALFGLPEYGLDDGWFDRTSPSPKKKQQPTLAPGKKPIKKTTASSGTIKDFFKNLDNNEDVAKPEEIENLAKRQKMSMMKEDGNNSTPQPLQNSEEENKSKKKVEFIEID
jgi:hypothetical protein